MPFVYSVSDDNPNSSYGKTYFSSLKSAKIHAQECADFDGLTKEVIKNKLNKIKASELYVSLLNGHTWCSETEIVFAAKPSPDTSPEWKE